MGIPRDQALIRHHRQRPPGVCLGGGSVKGNNYVQLVLVTNSMNAHAQTDKLMH